MGNRRKEVKWFVVDFDMINEELYRRNLDADNIISINQCEVPSYSEKGKVIIYYK